jgi:hypothetical protein
MLLPRNTNLWGLFAGRRKSVAMVWNTLGHRYSIRYAFLGPRGQVSRQGTIATGTQNFLNQLVAVNDRGDLAAAWTQVPNTPVLGLCAADRRCTAPRRLPIPAADPSLALTDSGTAIILGGDKGAPVSGPGRGPHPLRGVVARVGHREERVTRFAAEGYFAPVTADGEAGAVALVEPRLDRLASTFLAPRTDTFTSLQQIPDQMVNADFAVLAANLNGRVAAVWDHFSAFRNGRSEIRASLGRGTTLGQPVTIVGSSAQPYPPTIKAGIDGQGNAIVTWSQFNGDGNRGLFEAVHLQQ